MIRVHDKGCDCGQRTVGQILATTFEEELAYAEAEVRAAINAERIMEQVIGR